MKVKELFEAESTMSIIDREIQRQANSKKKGMALADRNKRTATRGFRVGFARDSWDGGEGLNDADNKIFQASIKAGKAAQKKYKGEIPPIQLKNHHGEYRPNPAFNKVIKPYLDAHHALQVKPLKEGATKTYYVHVDKDGKPTGPRATRLGNSNYGYTSLDVAIKTCPKGADVEERFTDGNDDWAGRMMFAGGKRVNEAREPLKFAIVDEGHWDQPNEDDDGGSSMIDLYFVDADKMPAGVHVADFEYDDEARADFIKMLERGKIGRKDGKVKIFNDDPDLGSEGVVCQDGTVHLLFTPL